MKYAYLINKSLNIDFYSANISSELSLPFVDSGISAGFPSPAEEYLDLTLDLNQELVKNPSSTFYGRVKGTSMFEAGIYDGDVLIIDKSILPSNGMIAVCFIDGEFTVKRIRLQDNKCLLVPANKQYPIIEVNEDNDFKIWGIVTYVIKKMLK
ncbi:Protein UmuD [Emticicia aquatica]|jgi:DNA polymerase V|uniref:Protein UmuD n=1 Tax=Emticicia aquatica TaxID=1681835 RepID=A0ABM9ALX5_9BACT|nr:translesion error-prone DNA polymerase V autoproteolytic subunit [Emticicia aquatica]CAH0994795.1 Protein UmuD [Emticicia aquatica]